MVPRVTRVVCTGVTSRPVVTEVVVTVVTHVVGKSFHQKFSVER